MKIYLIFLAMLALQACATPKYNYVPQSIDISEPPIGNVNVANIGDVLLRQGTYTEKDAIRVNQEFTVGAIGTYTFFPGYFVKVGQDKKAGYFSPEIGPEGGRVKAGIITDPYQSMQVYHDKDTVCGVSVFGGKVCKDNSPITRLTRPSLEANSFQQALIYSGRVGNKVTIGYRESSNNTARPAFNNDVEYDLTESHIIGYKGARLEIIEANNQTIKYRVLQNFNYAAQ